MSTPLPRAAIRRLAPYTPPSRRRSALRLDYNENLAGCPPQALQALRRLTAGALARYPDATPAQEAIAAAYGHPAAGCLLTNGLDDAIQLAALTFAGRGAEALVLEPGFALYRFYAERLGTRVASVALPWRRVATGVREFRFPLRAAMAAATARTRLVFLASPNNPTGHLTRHAAVLTLARQLPRAVIFADEAYADFADPPGESLLAAAATVPNLLVARTFSKAHGLAGLRLGALFGAPELIAWLRRAHSPYNVSAAAAVCGAAAAAAPAWAQACARQARLGRRRIEATLAELAIPYWRSQANFVLFDAGPRAAALLQAMRARRVLLRDRGGDLPGALRLGCGSARQTARACAALRQAWSGLA